MKWIIYLLLLINLGVFVWHYRDGTAPVATSAPDPALSLILLDEAETRSTSRVASSGACYTLGPFETRKQAGLAAAALRTQGIEAHNRVSKTARRKAYWVLLPPAKSRDEARKSLKKLKKLKVSDYFLVATGEKANAISLGVFSKFESAHRRIKQMQELGFKPTFEKVDLPRREYWLDWPAAAGELTDSVWETVRRIQPSARVARQECAAGTGLRPPGQVG